MIGVFVVDDHPLVRGGLAGALEAAPDMRLAGQAGSVAEALAALAANPVDVVLLDLRLPDGSGLEVLEQAARLAGAPAFIIVSSFAASQYVSAAIALGASGFLLKTVPTKVLLGLIRTVAGGRSGFTIEQLAGARRDPWRPLSELDAGLLRGVIAGRSNDELAADLGIARKTVEAHLGRLFARYGVVTRAELAGRAVEDGWLEMPREGTGKARPPTRR